MKEPTDLQQEMDEEQDRMDREERRMNRVVLENSREAVDRGWQWLDEHKPGWKELIDFGSFNFEDTKYCFLAQSFGWSVGTQAIYASGTTVSYLGFDADEDNPRQPTSYEALARAWEEKWKQYVEDLDADR